MGITDPFLFDQNKKLFELDYPTKMAFAHPPRPNPHRGYSYVGQENISAISGFERGEDSTASIVDLKVSWIIITHLQS